MNNPFAVIDARLSNIEALLLDIKHSPKEQQNYVQSEKFLTVAEVALLLNLTVPTIYSKVSKGELPVMKRSKRLYFSDKDIQGYLKKGRRKSIDEIVAQSDTHILSSKKF